MLGDFSQMLGRGLVDVDIDERLSGKILDGAGVAVLSYFNLPVVISGKKVGIINVASVLPDLYHQEDKDVLNRIIKQASDAVTRLHELLENEKGKLIQSVESISDGVLMVNTNYQVILANRKLRLLLGLADR